MHFWIIPTLHILDVWNCNSLLNCGMLVQILLIVSICRPLITNRLGLQHANTAAVPHESCTLVYNSSKLIGCFDRHYEIQKINHNNFLYTKWVFPEFSIIKALCIQCIRKYSHAVWNILILHGVNNQNFAKRGIWFC